MPTIGTVSAPARFATGSLVATPGSLRVLADAGTSPLALVARHIRGDWGDLCPEDRRENELALAKGFRILSAYTLPTGDGVWIITEADRSLTTILLPSEY